MNLPDDFLDAYEAGCSVWFEADGHTGCTVGFTTDRGRYEARFNGAAHLAAAYAKLRAIWRADYDANRKHQHAGPYQWRDEFEDVPDD